MVAECDMEGCQGFSRQGGLKPQDFLGITVTNNYGKHTKNYGNSPSFTR